MPRSVLCALVTSILLSGGCTGGGGADEGDAKMEKAPLAPPTFTVTGDPAVGRQVATMTCRICHVVEGEGGKLFEPMVVIVKKRVDQMKDYSESMRKLKATDPDRYAASAAEIEAIEAAIDPDEKLLLWFQSYLRNPNFDDPNNAMAAILLSDEQIQNLAAYLLQLKE